MISRFIEIQLLRKLKPGKVVVLLGARRVGKTILMEELKRKLKKKILAVHGENLEVSEILSSRSQSKLHRFTAGYEVLMVDEAQHIPNIGQNLKLLVDTRKDLAILVSGSSAFDMRHKVGEPLTGRGYFIYLYPLSQPELKEDFLKARENLEEKLIYGLYPEVFTAGNIKAKQAELTAIRDGYLLKDILMLDNLKDSLFVFNLLRLIAFQIGKDISYSELAVNLNVNKKTVMRYLELLEKTYVIYSLHGFSRNLRKEYSKSPRYYFWDNGIRNVIIANFNSLNMRDDVGALWENYCITERIKKLKYMDMYGNIYFWRTYDQQEVDLVEEREGKLYSFEFKWGDKKAKPPKDFIRSYPEAEYKVINRENYLEFIGS